MNYKTLTPVALLAAALVTTSCSKESNEEIGFPPPTRIAASTAEVVGVWTAEAGEVTSLSQDQQHAESVGAQPGAEQSNTNALAVDQKHAESVNVLISDSNELGGEMTLSIENGDGTQDVYEGAYLITDEEGSFRFNGTRTNITAGGSTITDVSFDFDMGVNAEDVLVLRTSLNGTQLTVNAR